MKRKIKKEILKTLENNPIVESACKKHGISRQTFYRWQKEDPDFGRKVEEIIMISHDSITDMAESQLFKKISEGNMAAIGLRLKTHSDRYRPRTEKRQTQMEGEIKKAQDDISFQELISRPVDTANMDPKLLARIRQRREEKARLNSSQESSSLPARHADEPPRESERI